MSYYRALLSACFSRRNTSFLCNNSFKSSAISATKRCYVRELDWCAPKSAPKKKWKDYEEKKTMSCTIPPATNKKIANNTILLKKDSILPHDDIQESRKFGVVAAMSRNNVIGLNGKLPWSHIAQDRQNFENLTAGKILIIGRHTFHEEEDMSHISHVDCCIVVSRTLDPDLYCDDDNKVKIRVVPSFTDALTMADEIITAKNAKESDENEIQCWVGGGEQIYIDALRYPFLIQELHLTIVDTDIDLESAQYDNVKDEKNREMHSRKNNIAFFPSMEQWTQNFEEIERWDGKKTIDADDDGSVHRCTFYVYKRRYHGSQ